MTFPSHRPARRRAFSALFSQFLVAERVTFFSLFWFSTPPPTLLCLVPFTAPPGVPDTLGALGTQLPQGAGAARTGPWPRSAPASLPPRLRTLFPQLLRRGSSLSVEGSSAHLIAGRPHPSGGVTGTRPTAPGTSAVPSPSRAHFCRNRQCPPGAAAAGPSLAPLPSSNGHSGTQDSLVRRISIESQEPTLLPCGPWHRARDTALRKPPAARAHRGPGCLRYAHRSPRICSNTLQGASRWASREAWGLGSGFPQTRTPQAQCWHSTRLPPASPPPAPPPSLSEHKPSINPETQCPSPQVSDSQQDLRG